MNGCAKAIRCIRANNQPILLRRELATPDVHQLDINDHEIERRVGLILESDSFRTKVGEAIAKRYPPGEPSPYVEGRIYDGFVSRPDEFLMEHFHQAPWEKEAGILDAIEDQRVRELGYRLIYTERPLALPAEKRAELDAWCTERLQPKTVVPWLTVAGAIAQAEELLADEECENRAFITEVRDWFKSVHP